MDFGIALATSTESWKAVKRAEELGFSHAWFYDTQLLNPDVFMGMTMAAMHTSRIRLGTGVLIPSNRIEPVTANALATLNKLAPGRIDFGVGTGFTGRRTMGLKAITLERMKIYIERVQRLLLGETITWDFEGHTRDIAFLNPDFGLINIDDPVHVTGLEAGKRGGVGPVYRVGNFHKGTEAVVVRILIFGVGNSLVIRHTTGQPDFDS